MQTDATSKSMVPFTVHMTEHDIEDLARKIGPSHFLLYRIRCRAAGQPAIGLGLQHIGFDTIAKRRVAVWMDADGHAYIASEKLETSVSGVPLGLEEAPVKTQISVNAVREPRRGWTGGSPFFESVAAPTMDLPEPLSFARAA